MDNKRVSARGIKRPASGIDINPAKLVRARERRFWSRAMLAAEAGVSASAIAAYENGERRPRLDTFANLAAALGVKPDSLRA